MRCWSGYGDIMNVLLINDKVKDIVKEKPLRLGILLTVLIAGLCFVLFILEILPEFEKGRWRRNVVIDRGDSLIWLGMEVALLSRDIKEEFRMPKRLKGIFVLDEGWGQARKQGVRTGDVIRSINRKNVCNRRSFIKVAHNIRYYDGILLDIYRDDKNLYLTIPFAYQNGPLLGLNRDNRQIGYPLRNQRLP